jgi:acyl carrier protein
VNFEKIRDVIVETLGRDPGRVTPETRLREDLHADSLTAVELCMALEEATGVQISDEAMPGFRTVGDILNYLKENEG